MRDEALPNQCADEVELRMTLATSQNKISELVAVNQQLQREVANLQTTVSWLLGRVLPGRIGCNAGWNKGF